MGIGSLASVITSQTWFVFELLFADVDADTAATLGEAKRKEAAARESFMLMMELLMFVLREENE